MKKEPNYQDLLKTLVLFTMIIDHCGVYFFPEQQIIRVIGRSAMPIFCFFAGYNFHNKPKSIILILGIILYIVSSILIGKWTTTNILIPIYLGQCYLYFFHNSLKIFFYSGYCHVIFLGTLWCITWFLVDYGSLVLAIMALGYIAKHDSDNLNLAVLISIILSLFHTIITFGFSDFYIVIVIILGIMEYMIMVMKNFNYKIKINLRIISRNSLYIYFIHLIIFEFIFAYFFTNR